MANAISKPVITIRGLESIDDLRKITDVEKAVWGSDERDTIPVLLFIAAKEAGSIFIGAFDDERLIGFAFGFPGLEAGHVSIHSHETAVLPEYRDLNLGYKLKLAQRERALQMGISEITWTFDPLQARNAHFNFSKLGVVSDRYKIDFYGHESSSVLHQNGTDRLWVSWFLDGARVRQKLASASEASDCISPQVMLVESGADARPRRGELRDALASKTVGIQIPSNIASIEENNFAVAREWREATRWAFSECLQNGFFVADFLRGRSAADPGTYLLEKGSMK